MDIDPNIYPNNYTHVNLTNITVLNTNRPPTLTGYPFWSSNVMYIPAGGALAYYLQPADPDKAECNDDTVTMEFSLSPMINPSTLSQIAGQWYFITSPRHQDVGQHELRLKAIDSQGAFVEKVVTVYVYEPVLSWNATENSTLTFTDTMETTNPLDLVAIQPQGLPPGATMPQMMGTGFASSVFAWTPNFCQGPQNYVFNSNHYLNDQLAYIQTHTISVGNVDRPPVITTSAASTASVKLGATLTLKFQKSDPDRDVCHDDSVTWGQVNMVPKTYLTQPNYVQSGGQYNDNLTWTWGPIKEGDLGTFNLTLVVDDTKGKWANKLIKVVAYRPSGGGGGCGGKFQRACT
ncbi:MAG TPA: hypothetical protein VJI13_03905 [Candidatus Norongarragalinales archaeon]|nr:hypothetical protein [Candidatus Norongarragalinales archaeon]